MFHSAFQSLSSHFLSPRDSFLSYQTKWRLFVESVVVTYVTGEIPNPSDSGFGFARRARQLLEIDEARIMDPSDAVRRLMRQPGPILFVDDFVGSGSQFSATWRRPVEVSPGTYVSFERLTAIARGAEFYYCPLICTEFGNQNLRQVCPEVRINPAHIISQRYNVFASDSVTRLCLGVHQSS